MDIEFENMGTVNKNRVDLGNLTLWFSYKTCVAFRDETGFYCSENVWSRTTGKLLNEICAKENRITNEEFEQKLRELLARISLVQIVRV